MIFLRILSKDESMIDLLALELLRENLVIDLTIKRHMTRVELINNELTEFPVYLLTAKTRGVLFTTIDKFIKKKYAKNMPEVYSLPIVHMDWEQADSLLNNIKVQED